MSPPPDPRLMVSVLQPLGTESHPREPRAGWDLSHTSYCRPDPSVDLGCWPGAGLAGVDLRYPLPGSFCGCVLFVSVSS